MQEYYHQKSPYERAKGYCTARVCVATTSPHEEFVDKFRAANESRGDFAMLDIKLSPVQAKTLVQVAWAQPALTSSLNAEDMNKAVREKMP